MVAVETPVADVAELSPGDEVDHIRREGYLVVRNAIDKSSCDAVREHALAVTDEAKRLGRADLFGNIQEAEKRHDLKLDLVDPVREAINQFAARCGDVLAEVMGGPVQVVELAAITSDPGAVAQPVHADTMHGITRFLESDVQLPGAGGDCEAFGEHEDVDEKESDVEEIVRAVATDTAMIFTALVALQDVESDMGPTHVWPGTHTAEHHATLWGTHVGGKLSVSEADKAFGVEHQDMTLRMGDLVLYDSRTMHCGGANLSQRRRSVLVISGMGPGIRPDGTTWTMLKSLRSRLQLQSIRTAPLQLGKAGTPATGTVPPSNVAAMETANGRAAAVDLAEEVAAGAGRPVPPLEDWAAAAQCSICTKWRPCSAEEAPRLTGQQDGFRCSLLGFSCNQEQRFTTQEIDDALFS